MRLSVTFLKEKLAKVLLGFSMIDEIFHINKETREKSDERFQPVYTKTVSLANTFGTD